MNDYYTIKGADISQEEEKRGCAVNWWERNSPNANVSATKPGNLNLKGVRPPSLPPKPGIRIGIVAQCAVLKAPKHSATGVRK